jgi:hypothetical protein
MNLARGVVEEGAGRCYSRIRRTAASQAFSYSLALVIMLCVEPILEYFEEYLPSAFYNSYNYGSRVIETSQPQASAIGSLLQWLPDGKVANKAQFFYSWFQNVRSDQK